jgi:hypothetical protein
MEDREHFEDELYTRQFLVSRLSCRR